MRRTPTGIKNLDGLIGGGFPKNSNILLTGEPGCGKTIFGLEYIYRGATEFDESGLFVSLEQKESDLIEQAQCFGWNMKKLTGKKKIGIMYVPIDKITRDLGEKIKQKAKELDVKRLVFDSLSLLSLNPIFLQDKKFSLASGEDLKVAFNLQQFIYNFIHLLEEIDATTLIIKNSKERTAEEDTVSEFVCDGVVRLKTLSMGKIQTRTLEIPKMRKTECKGGIYPLKITKEGMVVT